MTLLDKIAAAEADGWLLAAIGPGSTASFGRPPGEPDRTLTVTGDGHPLDRIGEAATRGDGLTLTAEEADAVWRWAAVHRRAPFRPRWISPCWALTCPDGSSVILVDADPEGPHEVLVPGLPAGSIARWLTPDEVVDLMDGRAGRWLHELRERVRAEYVRRRRDADRIPGALEPGTWLACSRALLMEYAPETPRPDGMTVAEIDEVFGYPGPTE